MSECDISMLGGALPEIVESGLAPERRLRRRLFGEVEQALFRSCSGTSASKASASRSVAARSATTAPATKLAMVSSPICEIAVDASGVSPVSSWLARLLNQRHHHVGIHVRARIRDRLRHRGLIERRRAPSADRSPFESARATPPRAHCPWTPRASDFDCTASSSSLNCSGLSSAPIDRLERSLVDGGAGISLKAELDDALPGRTLPPRARAAPPRSRSRGSRSANAPPRPSAFAMPPSAISSSVVRDRSSSSVRQSVASASRSDAQFANQAVVQQLRELADGCVRLARRAAVDDERIGHHRDSDVAFGGERREALTTRPSAP